MSRLAVTLVLLAVAAFATSCGGDNDAGVTLATASATAPTTAIPTRTPTSAPATTVSATPAASATAIAPVASPDAFAALAALNGLRCTGQWRNSVSGASGAFSVGMEAGGGGGLMSFEIGGPVFGAQGGVFEAPFRLDGSEVVMDARSDFLGHVSARVRLDGSEAQATLQAPPALGPAATVEMTDFSFANNVLHFGLSTDSGDGRPPGTSSVDAACAYAH